MRSIYLGKIAGIGVELHSTFVWLAIIVVLMLAVFMPEMFLPIIILLFFLFLSVFLHELVHSIVAVDKGCRVEKIILLPIGGVSLTEELPEKPVDEFLIAVAGPAFNFVVVIAIVLLVGIFPQIPFPKELASAEQLEDAIMRFPVFGLLWINLILGAFNLFLPALPLDGGRVARSLLAMKFGFAKATRLISSISSFVAILLFLIGFVTGNIILAIIAIFIFFGARQENEIAMVKEALRGTSLDEVINKKPLILDAELSLQDAFDEMQEKRELAFLVQLDDGFGLIDLEKLHGIEKKEWKGTALKEVCAQVQALEPGTRPSDAMNKVMSKGTSILPVMENGRLLGAVYARELQKLYELNKLKKMKE